MYAWPCFQGPVGATGRAGLDGIPGQDVRPWLQMHNHDSLLRSLWIGCSLVPRAAQERKESEESWATGDLW